MQMPYNRVILEVMLMYSNTKIDKLIEEVEKLKKDKDALIDRIKTIEKEKYEPKKSKQSG